MFDGFDNFAYSSLFKEILEGINNKINIAFIAFYGSRNYNLETVKSDYDFFAVYYPSFENFYENSFPRYSVLENSYDYFAAPLHEFIGHAMKGNIKFIEPFICNTIFSPFFSGSGLKIKKAGQYVLFDDLRKFISMNYKKNFNAMLGIAKNKKINVQNGSFTSTTLKYKEEFGYDIKEAINSLRIIFLLNNYVKTGELSFNVKDNPVYAEFEGLMSAINSGAVSKSRYIEIVSAKIDEMEARYKDVLLKQAEVEKAREGSEPCAYFELGEKIRTGAKLLCKESACLEKKR